MKDLFEFERPRQRFAVVGHPVAHSKSPQIHRAFASQCGLKIEYEAIQLDRGGFVQGIRNLQAGGLKGLNVTLPFKEEARALSDDLSDRARIAAAVNTFLFSDDGTIFGDNTDGIGLISDIQDNMGIQLKGRRALLVGAGGAARGVVQPLLGAGLAALVITNRTVERARRLAADVQQVGSVQVLAPGQVEDQRFDVVINATSAGLSGQVPGLPETIFSEGAMAYDMLYGSQPTPFMLWARSCGVSHAADGLGMLVEQAAESFFLWTKVRPQTDSVIQSLRSGR